MISTQLRGLAVLSSGKSSGKTDRKRVAAIEGEREAGDTTAGKEKLMRESQIGRKTTCPHVTPRSTGSDNILLGFQVLRHCNSRQSNILREVDLRCGEQLQ